MTTTIWRFPADLLNARTSVCNITRRNVFSGNPFSAFRRIVGPIDERWVIDVSIPPQSEDQLSRFEALIAVSDGTAGVVRAWDPFHVRPRNPIWQPDGNQAFTDGTRFTDGTGFSDKSYTATVDVAGAAGDAFVRLAGLQVSVSALLMASDHMEIGGLFYRVLNDTASDASGKAHVNIRPRLRAPVIAGDLVNFFYPSSVFAIAADDEAMTTRNVARTGSSSVKLIEVPEVALYGL